MIRWQFRYKFWYTYSNTLPGPEGKSDIFFKTVCFLLFPFSQPAEREKTGGSSTSAPLVIAFKSSKPFDNTRLFLWMLCLEGAHLSVRPYRFLAPIFHFTERSLTSRATSPRLKEDWPVATWQPLNSCSRKKFSQNPSLLTYMWQQTPDQLHSWQWFLFLSFHNCFI